MIYVTAQQGTAKPTDRLPTVDARLWLWLMVRLAFRARAIIEAFIFIWIWIWKSEK